MAYNLRSQKDMINTPLYISDNLASFLGKEKGSKITRFEVTHEINTYIRENNLQDKDNTRKINPDKKIQSLFNLQNTDKLTYFNIQSFLSPHFSNKATTS
jgi:chromatin remodeling complex protein RSC6